MRRLVAILNPQADRGRTAALADALRSTLERRFPLELLLTGERGEATNFARQAGIDGVDAVIAIGGDGTVHEVANGLMRIPAGARPTLGIVPAGSGNDVAFALGIDRDVARLAALIEQDKPARIDVGMIQASGGLECYCINNVGLLLEGEINRASHRYRWPRGAGLYIRAMLQSMLRPLPSAELTLTVDGVRMQRRTMILSVANGPRSGGRFQLMPEAALDDGRFDFTLAPPIGRLKLLWNARRALAGKQLVGNWFERGCFAELSVHSDRSLVAHVDGEPWIGPEAAVSDIQIKVLPAALRVFRPRVTPGGS